MSGQSTALSVIAPRLDPVNWLPKVAVMSKGGRNPLPAPLTAWTEYWVDAVQRTVLFLDVLRQRGNATIAATETEAPNVLGFDADLIQDGRTLARPVNYMLVRIKPPEGISVDPAKRPFIVFDPRAGHGPGIGGMRLDSEVGAALRAGNPCYFVGFLPRPCPGQTIEDVCVAEAGFIRQVAALHPNAPSAPALIGNCQAGWQVMMTAAMHPELPGPILLAGAPLSYWAGSRGKAPLRYAGGLSGGTWLTALAGDLGAGIFDGAALVENFEGMNPANTWFRKPYAMFDRVDSEAERFLSFEKWWGSPVLLNAEEMQWIADNLFVGNRLAAGQLRTSDGFRIDLRNIRSPIIVFCSWGDDITPPPQALGWLLDMYEHEREIVAAGQTVIYSVHGTIGHLGIFVSGKVATKEHSEFASCMDMIDLMPPGLYEAVIQDVTAETAHGELISGTHLFRLEARSLDHIRALGSNTRAEDTAFATVARVSDINNGLYRTLLQPMVQAMATPRAAEAMRSGNRYRQRFTAFSDRNPAIKAVAPLAEAVRQSRKPVADSNPYRMLEHAMADAIEDALQNYGALRDTWKEITFFSIFGSPMVQAMVGMQANNSVALHRIGRSVMRDAAAARVELEVTKKLHEGGTTEAFLRCINYVHRAERWVDERGFAEIFRLQAERPLEERLSFREAKAALREQAMLVGQDPEAALAALPDLLPKDPAAQKQLLLAIHRVIGAVGPIIGPTAARLARIEAIFADAAEAQPADESAAAIVDPRTAGPAPSPLTLARPVPAGQDTAESIDPPAASVQTRQHGLTERGRDGV